MYIKNFKTNQQQQQKQKALDVTAAMEERLKTPVNHGIEKSVFPLLCPFCYFFHWWLTEVCKSFHPKFAAFSSADNVAINE